MSWNSAYIKNGKRVIQVAIKQTIELPKNISDREIEVYLARKFEGEEYQWCDGDHDIFTDYDR